MKKNVTKVKLLIVLSLIMLTSVFAVLTTASASDSAYYGGICINIREEGFSNGVILAEDITDRLTGNEYNVDKVLHKTVQGLPNAIELSLYNEGNGSYNTFINISGMQETLIPKNGLLSIVPSGNTTTFSVITRNNLNVVLQTINVRLGFVDAEGTEYFNSGDGTASNPFVITKPEHLDNMRFFMNSHYELGADINLDAYICSNNEFNINPAVNSNWRGIGLNANYAFGGSLNGGENSQNANKPYKISNIHLLNDSFIKYAINSDFNNLIIENAYLKASSSVVSDAAILVQYAKDTYFTNLDISGVIDTTARAGGIAAAVEYSYSDTHEECIKNITVDIDFLTGTTYPSIGAAFNRVTGNRKPPASIDPTPAEEAANNAARNIIKNVHVTTDFNAGSNSGGIVGILTSFVFQDCSFTGSINIGNVNYIGGLAGRASYAGIGNNCMTEIDFNNDKSSSSAGYVGGMIGYTDNDISFAQNVNVTGKISLSKVNTNYIGGLVGGAANSAILTTGLNLQINLTNLTGYNYIGGIVGSVGSVITAAGNGTTTNINIGQMSGCYYLGGIAGNCIAGISGRADAYTKIGEKFKIKIESIYATGNRIGGAFGHLGNDANGIFVAKAKFGNGFYVETKAITGTQASDARMGGLVGLAFAEIEVGDDVTIKAGVISGAVSGGVVGSTSLSFYAGDRFRVEIEAVDCALTYAGGFAGAIYYNAYYDFYFRHGYKPEYIFGENMLLTVNKITGSYAGGFAGFCDATASTHTIKPYDGIGVIKNVNIKNTNVYGTNYVGGFAGTMIMDKTEGMLENITVDNVNVVAGKYIQNSALYGGSYAGGFAGSLVGAVQNITVTNAYVEAQVNFAGGFAGEFTGNASEIEVNATAVGVSYVGGFAGRINGNNAYFGNLFEEITIGGASVVKGLYNKVVPVSNGSYIGGFAGQINAGCLVQNNIVEKGVRLDLEEGRFTNVGGFAGNCTSSKIKDCLVEDISIWATNTVGGFVGSITQATGWGSSTLEGNTIEKVIIITVPVAGQTDVGGFAGSSSGTVASENYITGNTIEWLDLYCFSMQYACVGGFVGGRSAYTTYSANSVAGQVTSTGTIVAGFGGCFDSGPITIEDEQTVAVDIFLVPGYGASEYGLAFGRNGGVTNAAFVQSNYIINSGTIKTLPANGSYPYLNIGYKVTAEGWEFRINNNGLEDNKITVESGVDYFYILSGGVERPVSDPNSIIVAWGNTVKFIAKNGTNLKTTESVVFEVPAQQAVPIKPAITLTANYIEGEWVHDSIVIELSHNLGSAIGAYYEYSIDGGKWVRIYGETLKIAYDINADISFRLCNSKGEEIAAYENPNRDDDNLFNVKTAIYIPSITVTLSTASGMFETRDALITINTLGHLRGEVMKLELYNKATGQWIFINEWVEGVTTGFESTANAELSNRTLQYTIKDLSRNGQYRITLTDKSGRNFFGYFELNNVYAGSLDDFSVTNLTCPVEPNPSDWYYEQLIQLSVSANNIRSISYTHNGAPYSIFNNANLTDIAPYALFAATKNGEYKFTIVDSLGNSVSRTLIISNIDSVEPKLVLSYNTSGWYSANEGINYIIQTGASGVKEFTVTHKGVTTDLNPNLSNYPVSGRGEYVFTLINGAGKKVIHIINVVNIETNTALTMVVTDSRTSNQSFIVNGWSTKEVTFDFSTVQNISCSVYYEYSIDSGRTWTRIVGTRLTISQNTDAKYMFRALTDLANLKDTPSTVYDVKVDMVEPVIYYTSKWSQDNTKATFTIRSTNTLGDYEVYYQKVGGTEVLITGKNYDNDNKVISYYITLDIPESETDEYSFSILTASGLYSQINSILVKADNNVGPFFAPVVTFISGGTYFSSRTEVKLSLPDGVTMPVSGISYQYRIGEGEWQNINKDILVIDWSVNAEFFFRYVTGIGLDSTPSESYAIKVDNEVHMYYGFNADDKTNGTWIKVDGGSPVNMTATAPEDWKSGNYRMYLWFVSGATGNPFASIDVTGPNYVKTFVESDYFDVPRNGLYTFVVVNGTGIVQTYVFDIHNIDSVTPIFNVSNPTGNAGVPTQNPVVFLFNTLLAGDAGVSFYYHTGDENWKLINSDIFTVNQQTIGVTYTFAVKSNVPGSPYIVYPTPYTLYIYPTGSSDVKPININTINNGRDVQIIRNFIGTDVKLWLSINGASEINVNDIDTLSLESEGQYRFILRRIDSGDEIYQYVLTVAFPVAKGISNNQNFSNIAEIENKGIFDKNLTIAINMGTTVTITRNSQAYVIQGTTDENGGLEYLFDQNGTYQIILTSSTGIQTTLSFTIDKPNYTLIITISAISLLVICIIMILVILYLRNRRALMRLISQTTVSDDSNKFVMFKKIK